MAFEACKPLEVQNAKNSQYKLPQNLKIIFMLKFTNKLQIKQCKELITYSSRGTQSSIKKYNFEYIHTLEELGARSSAKVSLHNITRFSQGMWLYSSLKCLPEMPKA